MLPSQACFDLIEKFETCRLTAYLDPVGIPTIGWGHTSASVRLGDVINKVQADTFLIHDVTVVGCEVEHALPTTLVLTQPQFDALVSFVYNVGIGKWMKSTMYHMVSGGCFTTAAEEFTKWVLAGGVPLAGLVRRRQAEQALFLSGTAAEPQGE